MNIPNLPEGHHDLIRIVHHWGDQSTIDTYLDLLSVLLEGLDLPNGHPQLVTNTGKPKSVYVLATTLGMRYLLAFHRRQEMAFLILPRGYEHGHPLFESMGHFDALRGERDVPPAYGLTRNLRGVLENEQVVKDWKAAARAEINRQSQSTFKRHHKPALYEAARNSEYRELVFYQAFNSEN
ncbi:MAG: hypothetical protein Q4C89_04440 [Deinococcus sp.]|uniref:hypothetical protein n=1 Tax=Deinococcus sp. TaxID=47478 RepID=UPI0026DBDCDE|nr:hypothetical protein [Deinococcus sp.]MDO4245249.1 hypothetical protein [Deinococcus sp.]